MNYNDALGYIYGFSDFERSGTYNRDRGENLPREAALLKELGNPQLTYTNTLIAGTKGKGSTAALIESVLRAAGVRTGLYTQPDLHTFRERMRVNGHLISEQEVGELIPDVRRAVEIVQARNEFGPFITYEIGTALALLFFSRQHVQHAVLEVGLGGRLDATNVTHPLVSVIASISYDHMQILGNTLAQIATEKAGIIKEHGLVVTSAQSPEALLAIAAICRQRQASMIRVGSSDPDSAQAEVDADKLSPLSYRYQLEARQYTQGEAQRFTIYAPEHVYSDLEIPLIGVHQIENATLALATLEQLRKQGINWNEEALHEGFRSVHWPARIEVVGHNPTVIVDGAHNADSMQKLLQALHSRFTFKRLLVVLGASKDKDLAGMVRELKDVDIVILTGMNNPRSTPTEELKAAFARYAQKVQIHDVSNSEQALDLALQLAGRDDLICATGSIYLAGEALRWAAAHGDSTAASEIEGVDH